MQIKLNENDLRKMLEEVESDSSSEILLDIQVDEYYEINGIDFDLWKHNQFAKTVISF